MKSIVMVGKFITFPKVRRTRFHPTTPATTILKKAIWPRNEKQKKLKKDSFEKSSIVFF